MFALSQVLSYISHRRASKEGDIAHDQVIQLLEWHVRKIQKDLIRLICVDI